MAHRVDLVGNARIEILSGKGFRIADLHADDVHAVFCILVKNLRRQAIDADSGNLLLVVAPVVEEDFRLFICLADHTAADKFRNICTRCRRQGNILLRRLHRIRHIDPRIVSARELALDRKGIRILESLLIPDTVPESLDRRRRSEILRIYRYGTHRDMVEIRRARTAVVDADRRSALIVDLVDGLFSVFIRIIVGVSDKEAVPDGTAVFSDNSGSPAHCPLTVVVLVDRIVDHKGILDQTGRRVRTCHRTIFAGCNRHIASIDDALHDNVLSVDNAAADRSLVFATHNTNVASRVELLLKFDGEVFNHAGFIVRIYKESVAVVRSRPPERHRHHNIFDGSIVHGDNSACLRDL